MSDHLRNYRLAKIVSHILGDMDDHIRRCVGRSDWFTAAMMHGHAIGRPNNLSHCANQEIGASMAARATYYHPRTQHKFEPEVMAVFLIGKTRNGA